MKLKIGFFWILKKINKMNKYLAKLKKNKKKIQVSNIWSEKGNIATDCIEIKVIMKIL